MLCTNVGSAGAMMGNPVGIYIGTQAGLTFQDFILWAFPVMLLALAATLGVPPSCSMPPRTGSVRRRLADRLSRNLGPPAPPSTCPHRQGVILLTVTFLIIASHHQVEHLLGSTPTAPCSAHRPLACAGGVMIWRHKRARFYIEQEVDWWTLLFFMLLFAVAGTLEHVGLTQKMARGFTTAFGPDPARWCPSSSAPPASAPPSWTTWSLSPLSPRWSGPVRKPLRHALWWAMLFGACFGGSITLIGSTANIVALGLLEKHGHVRISFWQWFKVGAVSAVVRRRRGQGALAAVAPHGPLRRSPPWSVPNAPSVPAPVLPAP